MGAGDFGYHIGMDHQQLQNLVDFWPGRALLTAVELGIFPELQDSRSAEEISTALDTDLAATTRLLDALAGLGILAKGGGEYKIAEGLESALAPGPGGILPALEHRAVLWHRWSALTDVVRKGSPVAGDYTRDERPIEEVRSFIGAMAVVGKPAAMETASHLDIASAGTLLDIGGGPAVYAMEFCRAAQGLKATILDLPRVCGIARENLARDGTGFDIGFVEGEALSVKDEAVLAASGGEGFGMVFMSNLIHSFAEGQVRELFSRCARWTRPGGSIVVKDFLLDDTKTQPASAAVFSLNMLVNNHGRSYTWSEVEQWLEEAVLNERGAAPQCGRIAMADGRSGMVVATAD